MKIKPGVRLHGIRPEMVLALMAADAVWQKQGVELTITSGIEGAHMENSLHYVGCAVDLRTSDFKDADAITVAIAALKEALGDDFDVVLEQDHVHLEWQPHVRL